MILICPTKCSVAHWDCWNIKCTTNKMYHYYSVAVCFFRCQLAMPLQKGFRRVSAGNRSKSATSPMSDRYCNSLFSGLDKSLNFNFSLQLVQNFSLVLTDITHQPIPLAPRAFRIDFKIYLSLLKLVQASLQVTFGSIPSTQPNILK